MIFKRKWMQVLWLVVLLPMLISFTPPQEARVNQKKIEKERAKKEKQSKKQYEKAVKRHHNMQTKETKSRMKQTKRESKSSTPLQR